MAERVQTGDGYFLPDVVAAIRWDGEHRSLSVSMPGDVASRMAGSKTASLVAARLRPTLLATIATQVQIPVYELTDELLADLAARAASTCSVETRLLADGSVDIDAAGIDQGPEGRVMFASALAAGLVAAG